MEELIELIESTANMLRGACMDPRIPKDTKEAFWSRVRELDNAVIETSRVVVGPLDQPVGLTEQERRTLAMTADCWNSWCSLPGRDAADNEEFMRAIHAAQHLIALRVARRADPDVWRQPNAEVDRASGSGRTQS